MRVIDADTAQDGLTLIARHQTGGKGQRGRTWRDTGTESLLMSIVVCPEYTLEQQFAFSALIAATIAETVQGLCENANISVKWPNDIIVNDKKAGGVLIENVLRGSKWVYAVIGLGLNVRQTEFPGDLPNATSLYHSTGKILDAEQLGYLIRRKLLLAVGGNMQTNEVVARYNEILYKKGQKQLFIDANGIERHVRICEALPNGQLLVQNDSGLLEYYTHGTVNWKWQ